MSITAERIARRELLLLEAPDKIPVTIKMRDVGGIRVPSEEGDIEESAVFKVWTYSDNHIIEAACQYRTKRQDGKWEDHADVNEMRRLMLKRSLLSWSLDVPIERENGWMTPDCYKRVGNVFAPVLEAFLWEFEKSFIVTEDEETLINRQCAILFSQNSGGVNNACEAVSMFCTYGNFNEKFGIDREHLPQIPFKEYQMLRMVMGKEGAAAKRNRGRKDHHSNTRVAMGSKNIRASRGKRIAL